MNTIKRFLGIDYGTKKVGLALSDENGRLAFPKAVLPNDSKLMTEIKKICEAEKVSQIVLGQSLSFSGVENFLQAEIARFRGELEQIIGLPIHFEQEIWSSAEAGRYQAGRGPKDDSAAAIILQRFLDKK